MSRKSSGASVRARLLNLAKTKGMIYNQALVRYALEGLLLRLSLSPYTDRFVLKGAMLYILWQPDNPPRATRDLDLLCFGSPEPARCQKIFQDIAQIEATDGLQFKSSSVQAEPIRLEDLYSGIRVTLTAYLDTARIPLQVDVGFGDQPIPEALYHSYPALLREQKPRVRAYAPETVIAEKLHAMAERGLANSRFKDFFDVDYLADHFSFQSESLSEAIRATFQRRGRTFPTLPLVAWTPVFHGEPSKQAQWVAFLRKASLMSSALPDVMARIESFLLPPLTRARDQYGENATWPPGGPWVSAPSVA